MRVTKKLIVIDTNIYGWYIAYNFKGSRQPEAFNSLSLISRLLENKEKKINRIDVLATETVEREIKQSKEPILIELFYSLVKGIIKNTKKVKELSNEYFKSCKKEKLHFVTIDDCEIVAATTLAGVKLLVTENRKTLNNPKVAKVFESINSSKKFRSVKIVDSKGASDIFV